LTLAQKQNSDPSFREKTTELRKKGKKVIKVRGRKVGGRNPIGGCGASLPGKRVCPCVLRDGQRGGKDSGNPNNQNKESRASCKGGKGGKIRSLLERGKGKVKKVVEDKVILSCVKQKNRSTEKQKKNSEPDVMWS